MAKNYYGDDGAQPAKPAAAPEKDDDSAGAGMETALLPKSLFHGKDLKPGDKCDITVVRVHEDQVEVEGCEGGEEDEEQPQEQGGAPAEDAGDAGDAGGGDDSGSGGMYG
ncbi:MAG TPA: hypothetical protein VMQ76_06010 [Terracidiphilus sp.]|nr:hypothetical protein [Terracidiphilus sp.]